MYPPHIAMNDAVMQLIGMVVSLEATIQHKHSWGADLRADGRSVRSVARAGYRGCSYHSYLTSAATARQPLKYVDGWMCHVDGRAACRAASVVRVPVGVAEASTMGMNGLLGPLGPGLVSAARPERSLCRRGT